MSLSAEERHEHRQALCKWLQYDCDPSEECNTNVVPMVHTPAAKSWRQRCNVTRRLGKTKCVVLRQRVRGSVRAVRAIWNTRVFQKETRDDGDLRLSVRQKTRTNPTGLATYDMAMTGVWRISYSS